MNINSSTVTMPIERYNQLIELENSLTSGHEYAWYSVFTYPHGNCREFVRTKDSIVIELTEKVNVQGHLLKSTLDEKHLMSVELDRLRSELNRMETIFRNMPLLKFLKWRRSQSKTSKI